MNITGARKSRLIFLLFFLLLLLLSTVVYAGSRDQAIRMHDRLTGVPPDAVTLTSMVQSIDNGQPEEAARLAIEHPDFYTVTLKNFVTPWTNEAQTVFAPLNDYTATVIGVVRDELDFRTILYDDILYVGEAHLGLPAYSISNNDHYEEIERRGLNLKDSLARTVQSQLQGGEVPTQATAGVMTSRAAAKAFFIGGTNRAMFRFTLMNHLCTDMEQIKDISRPSDRIRQDVSRSPGGDSRIFMNACGGCHAGMDPLAQAFAYYDYVYDDETDPEAENGAISYNNEGEVDPVTGSRVKEKYLINAGNFKYGYATPNDRWDNYWRSGPNSLLGWDTNNLGLASGGMGAKSLGMELANSEAFASCQVKKVFKAVCFRSAENQDDRDLISSATATFKNNYNLKDVFTDVAVYCKGD